MTLDERVIWLLLGVVIGYFLSYMTRTVRETLEEVHEVKLMLKNDPARTRNERGAVDRPTFNQIALVIVLLLTAFAAFQSQQASNKVKTTQDELEDTQVALQQVTTCNRTVLSQALSALNTRTSYTQAAAGSNLTLVKAQVTMFDVLLHRPPYSEMTRFEATEVYNRAAKTFIELGTESQNNALTTKYPTDEDLATCIVKSMEDDDHKKE